MAQSLSNLGLVSSDQGDYASARVLLEESLTVRRAAGDKRGIALALHNLGYVAQWQGDDHRAVSLLGESLALARELGDKRLLASTLGNLGRVAYHRGEQRSAAALLQQSLALYRELGDTGSIAEWLEGLARVAAAQGQSARAAALFGSAEALCEASGAPLPPAEHIDHDRVVAAVHVQLGEAAFAAAWATGRARSAEEAIASALGAEAAVPAPTIPTPAAAPLVCSLSAREREVAALLAQGRTNARIAAALGIAERTAETHVGNILRKLGLTSRDQVAAWARQQGFPPAAAG
ncbi:MAG: LuxR family transcriptional regulator [Chloroflexota bacterium]|nr:LuxR family transcriptional regulator [Chloroflexota bacterium]